MPHQVGRQLGAGQVQQRQRLSVAADRREVQVATRTQAPPCQRRQPRQVLQPVRRLAAGETRRVESLQRRQLLGDGGTCPVGQTFQQNGERFWLDMFVRFCSNSPPL